MYYIKSICQPGYDRIDSLLIIQSPAINITATQTITKLTNYLTLGSAEKLVFVTSSTIEGNDCHACAPLIGAFVFTKSGDYWTCESKDFSIGEIGSYGEPAAVKTVQVGANSFALVFEDDDLVQGYSVEYAMIYPYFKNKFIEGISLTTHSDNSGTDEEKWEMKATYSFSPVDGQEFYELTVESKGTVFDDDANKIVDANKTEKYSFNQGKYNLVKTLSNK